MVAGCINHKDRAFVTSARPEASLMRELAANPLRYPRRLTGGFSPPFLPCSRRTRAKLRLSTTHSTNGLSLDWSYPAGRVSSSETLRAHYERPQVGLIKSDECFEAKMRGTLSTTQTTFCFYVKQEVRSRPSIGWTDYWV